MDALIYDALRTPRGKGREGGGLNSTAPVGLLATLFAAARQRNNLDPAVIDDIVLGCVTQVGEQGGNIAKVAALHAGLPTRVSGVTINRYCTSGLDACNFAAMKVISGVDELVFAGGVESMSRVPMLADKATFYTDPDTIRRARFVPMGVAADLVASLDGATREQCDAYAVRSQQRAAIAQAEGRFERSLVPVASADGLTIDADESVRGSVTVEKLASFEPLFEPFARQGYEPVFRAAFPQLEQMRYVHHAGNSPGIVDGASLVVIGSRAAGEKHGLKARARIRAMVNVSSSELLALTGGIDAAAEVLRRAGLRAADVDLVEFNEAFAAVCLRFLREAGFPEDRVNVNGGAIALGHAMGATGASLVGTVLDELERTDGTLGLIAVSGAAGIGTATIIERL